MNEYSYVVKLITLIFLDFLNSVLG